MNYFSILLAVSIVYHFLVHKDGHGVHDLGNGGDNLGESMGKSHGQGEHECVQSPVMV